MKIVLADCYHDSDKGGAGMVVGAVNAIRAACARLGATAEISLLFRFSEDDPKFAGASRLTRKAFPDLPVLPAPISSRRGPGLHWVAYVLRVVFLCGFRLAAPGLSRHPGVVAMREADVVLFKGGNFYRSWSSNAAVDFIAMLLLFYPVLLALRMGKRFAVVSHTFGPFETGSARRFVGWLMRRAPTVTAREAVSSDILIACGVPAAHVAVTPDFGFGAESASDAEMAPILARHGLRPGRYLAFTTRPWFYAERRRGDETRYRAYVANAAALLDWSLEAGHVDRVALVVQNDGAHSANEPDLPVLHDIRARMRQADRTVLMADDFTSQELCGVYRTALAVLGTRLHSCIFASVVGTPPVAIAYSHKAQGIMGMLNLADHVLDIHDLSVERGQAILGKIAAERDALAAQMRPRVAQLRRDLEQAVLQALAGGQADAVRRA